LSAFFNNNLGFFSIITHNTYVGPKLQT
jgi:hypothetical protein